MKIVVMKVSVVLMALGVLSGCTGMNGDFGCNATAGSNCTSVSQVNAKADAGIFNDDFSDEEEITPPVKQVAKHNTNLAVIPKPRDTVPSGEHVQRIWIAPYRDQSNNYHAQSYLYATVKKAPSENSYPHETNPTSKMQDHHS